MFRQILLVPTEPAVVIYLPVLVSLAGEELAIRSDV